MGCPAQKLYLVGCFDCANGVKVVGAVDSLQIRKQTKQRRPTSSAEPRLVEPDAGAVEVHVCEHPRQGDLRRVAIVLIRLESCRPAGRLCQFGCDLTEHYDRLARPRPKDKCLAWCVGQVQVPRQRAWRGDSREIGHVDPPAADESVDLPLSKHSVETRDVDPG